MNDLTRLINLDLDALRSFVVGIELGNFNQAAQQLCRSPAAISAQLKKLETQTACQLLKKQGRNLVVTAQGELLFRVAKDIFFKNDTVLVKLKDSYKKGEIYFGLQEDCENSLLQEIISKFIEQYPNVKFQTQVDRNLTLIQKIEQQYIDLGLIWKQKNLNAYFKPIRKTATFWLKQHGFPLEQLLNQKRSIPLIVINEPCMLRQMAISSLDEHNIAWHIVYECNSVNALWSAVRAGLGIIMRMNFAIPKDINIIKNKTVPQLKPMTLGIYSHNKIESDLISYFKECIINCVCAFL